MLTVLEAIAANQPIGASALARLLEEDKSAIQRSLVTLANAGWVRMTDEPPVRWELSARLFSLAHLPHSSGDLRKRARRILEELRDQTGETAFLVIPDISHFIVIEVVESRHMLRMVPSIGEIITVDRSATGRAMLPYYDADRRRELLGHEPTGNDLAEYEVSRKLGYGLSAGEIVPGATTMAAPVFDLRGHPMAAIVITGPSERISPEKHPPFGAMLLQAAAQLSRRHPVQDED